MRFFLKLPERKVRAHPGVPLVGDEHDRGIQDLYAWLSHYEPTTISRYRLPRGTHPYEVGAHQHHTRMTHLAMMFLMLTASPRKSEVIYATWGQMHLERDDPQWWVPGRNMKKDKDRENGVFIRPLSYAAVRLLRAIRPANAKDTDAVFTNQKNGRFMSAAAFNKFMNRHAPGKTPHGFRHVLTDWVGENHPLLFPALQKSLDHEIKSFIGATGSYFKSDLLPQRRLLAEMWADFLEAKLPEDEHTKRPPNRDPVMLHEVPPSQWPQLQHLRAV
jgi:integrase